VIACALSAGECGIVFIENAIETGSWLRQSRAVLNAAFPSAK
jgi:hypothetical protein